MANGSNQAAISSALSGATAGSNSGNWLGSIIGAATGAANGALNPQQPTQSVGLLAWVEEPAHLAVVSVAAVLLFLAFEARKK